MFKKAVFLRILLKIQITKTFMTSKEIHKVNKEIWIIILIKLINSVIHNYNKINKLLIMMISKIIFNSYSLKTKKMKKISLLNKSKSYWMSLIKNFHKLQMVFLLLNKLTKFVKSCAKLQNYSQIKNIVLF